MPDLYSALGVKPDATKAEIRRAYRRAAKSAHPDHGGKAERWALVKTAHDVLTDDARRVAYDTDGVVAEPPKDTRLADAMGLISLALDKVLGEIDNNGERVTQADIVLRAKRVISGQQSEQHTMLRKIAAGVTMNEEMRGRFSVKDGENMMEALITNRIANLAQMKINAQRNIEALQFAYDILQRHAFRADPMDRQSMNRVTDTLWSQVMSGQRW
jgi:curved DNA-binding protein CbpA